MTGAITCCLPGFLPFSLYHLSSSLLQGLPCLFNLSQWFPASVFGRKVFASYGEPLGWSKPSLPSQYLCTYTLAHTHQCSHIGTCTHTLLQFSAGLQLPNFFIILQKDRGEFQFPFWEPGGEGNWWRHGQGSLTSCLLKTSGTSTEAEQANPLPSHKGASSSPSSLLNDSGKQQRMAPGINSWIPALDWPSSGPCDHSGNDPVDWIFLSLSASFSLLSLPFFVTQTFK